MTQAPLGNDAPSPSCSGSIQPASTLWNSTPLPWLIIALAIVVQQEAVAEELEAAWDATPFFRIRSLDDLASTFQAHGVNTFQYILAVYDDTTPPETRDQRTATLLIRGPAYRQAWRVPSHSLVRIVPRRLIGLHADIAMDSFESNSIISTFSCLIFSSL